MYYCDMVNSALQIAYRVFLRNTSPLSMYLRIHSHPSLRIYSQKAQGVPQNTLYSPTAIHN